LADGDAAGLEPRRAARRELSEALRSLLDVMARAPAEVSELRELAASVRGTAARWAALPEERPRENEMLAGMSDFRERGPIVGQANPIAPPARYWFDEAAGEARGEVCFGNAYEGGPGVVHGGFLSAVLDEVLGFTTIQSGKPGFTGELTVRYLGPTPIGRPLAIAARYEHSEGRRIYATGELRDGDRVTCRAEGLFISIDAERFAQMQREREERGGGSGRTD